MHLAGGLHLVKAAEERGQLPRGCAIVEAEVCRQWAPRQQQARLLESGQACHQVCHLQQRTEHVCRCGSMKGTSGRVARCCSSMEHGAVLYAHIAQRSSVHLATLLNQHHAAAPTVTAAYLDAEGRRQPLGVSVQHAVQSEQLPRVLQADAGAIMHEPSWHKQGLCRACAHGVSVSCTATVHGLLHGTVTSEQSHWYSNRYAVHLPLRRSGNSRTRALILATWMACALLARVKCLVCPGCSTVLAAAVASFGAACKNIRGKDEV